MERRVRWKTSSYSGQNGGQCVEIGYREDDADDAVLIRDSKNPAASHLTVNGPAFRTWLASMKNCGQ